MYFLGSLLISIAEILAIAIEIYQFVIIFAVIISWLGVDPYNPIVRFFRQMTEPLFYRVRKILPKFFFSTRIDFTPLIVLLLLFLFRNTVLSSLIFYGQKIRGQAG